MASRIFPSNRRIFGIGELGRRLILAFVGVAIATIAAEVIISAAATDAGAARFVSQLETHQTDSVAMAAGSAYLGAGHFDTARLAVVADLAAGTGAKLQVRNPAGKPVITSPGYGSYSAKPGLTAPIYARAQRVGSVTLRFDHEGIGAAAAAFEAERWHARLYAAAIAVVVAVLVSVAVARTIIAPLERVLTAMRARGAGDRSIRIDDVRAIGVLRELLDGFNAATDALDQQDRAQRNLVANVAHELRTPVAVLQAGTEAMLDGITPATPDNLSSLHDEVLRLGHLLEDLQALAAAEAAALQLRVVSSDLAAIAGDAAASLKEPFEVAGVRLRSGLAEAFAPCDPDRIREIVMNLLTNALKYTPAGGSVLITTGPGSRKTAKLTVSDTGVGIPPDELPRVTERFFRGKQSAELAAGSGFGLTIVSELVRAHHGDLVISSRPGSGTQVTITIPRAGEVREGGPGRWRATS